jgi:exonuclease III
MHSFEKLLKNENPSAFCIQETKLKKVTQIRTESYKNYTIYELLRKNSNGGGLCIGVQNYLKPVWVGQGDDEVEALAVEIWFDDLPIRIVTAYGPQVGDSVERKLKFWDFIEREANNTSESGSGFILQKDSNAHLGKDVIKKGPNDQNSNGRL